MKKNADSSGRAAFSGGDFFRPKVLLLAYSISPNRGSEYSVGWNHVTHLQKFCDLTVLYGLAGSHMGDFEEIEDYVEQYSELDHVHFVPIRPNRLARCLNAPNRAGILVYSFYLAYRVWHWQAACKARKIIAHEQFDLIHYLCPIGYREPGYLWRLGIPFVWGPIGGVPSTLILRGAPRPPKAVLKVWLKNLANRINLSLAHRVARALRHADTVIAATSENKEMLDDWFGVSPLLIAENAIPDEALQFRKSPGRLSGSAVRMIWIGSLDWRKSPDLLLDALSAMASRDWTLDIVGTGPLLESMKALAIKLDLRGNITFHGQIPRAQVQDLLAQAHLHIITSMGEGNPTTVWEAMAVGVPTLTLDHCGMHDVVCENCGVRITPTDYAGTRDSLANEIEALIVDRDRIATLTAGVMTCREQHLWSVRSQQWLDIYRGAIARAL